MGSSSLVDTFATRLSAQPLSDLLQPRGGQGRTFARRPAARKLYPHADPLRLGSVRPLFGRKWHGSGDQELAGAAGLALLAAVGFMRSQSGGRLLG